MFKWVAVRTTIEVSVWVSCQIRKIADAHAPTMSGTFSLAPRVSDPDMHHDTCVMREFGRGEKHSRHSRRMRNSQFYVSGKRLIGCRCGILHYPSTSYDKLMTPSIPSLSRCVLIRPPVPVGVIYINLQRKLWKIARTLNSYWLLLTRISLATC